MELITTESQHSEILKKYIPKSDRIYIAVAFLKDSGLNVLIDSLLKAANRDCDIRIFCGLDFALTEPTALKNLWKMSLKYKSLNLYLSNAKNENVIFHPKLYLLTKQSRAIIIGGSANLTRGGLVSNHECSIMVKKNIDSKIYRQAIQYFESLADNGVCVKATLLRIKNYENFYEEQKLQRRKIKAKPTKGYGEFNFSYGNLLKLYRKYKEVKDVESLFQVRMKKYDRAREILDEIAMSRNLNKEQFIDLFEQLVGGVGIKPLWHSGSIFRTKTTVFDNFDKFQELVRFIKENTDQPASKVFDYSKSLVKNIQGSGINTVTEIMMTYNSKDFANLNKNPISVLIDKAGVNIKKYRNSYNGIDYAEYCELVREICETVGLRNMLEADSFFNEIYWGFIK